MVGPFQALNDGMNFVLFIILLRSKTFNSCAFMPTYIYDFFFFTWVAFIH